MLAKTKTTGEALIIEIKMPCTALLGPQYRQDVYPLSSELSGALSQVLHYRSALTRNILQLREDVEEQLESDLPRCVVIAGNVSKELDSRSRRRSFDRMHSHLGLLIRCASSIPANVIEALWKLLKPVIETQRRLIQPHLRLDSAKACTSRATSSVCVSAHLSTSEPISTGGFLVSCSPG